MEAIKQENRIISKELKGITVKRFLVISVMTIALLFMMFGDVLCYSNSRAAIEKGYSGIRLLIVLFSAAYSQNALISKDVSISYTIPVFAVVTFVLLLLMLVSIIGIYVLMGKKTEKSKLYGFAMLIYALLLTLAFIVMIFLKNPVESAGQEVEFYNVFHIKKLYFAIIILMLIAGGIQLGLKPKYIAKAKRFWFIYVIISVPVLCMLLFCYYPILLQFIMSFKDYKSMNGIWGSKWVGFEYFKQIFTSSEMRMVVMNSIWLSILTLLCTMIPQLFLAIMLFDMKKPKYQKGIQTIIYLPHFFSWVIIYAIYYALMSNSGLVNSILQNVHGDPNYYRDFLTDPSLIRLVLMIALIWKETGWGTILYTAALSNIDPTLYEAAIIDGAGPMDKLFKITLPSISPIIIFMFIMAIGGILNNSLDQILLFSNTVVLEKVYTIEVWVYKHGIGEQQFGLAAAAGFIQSLIGLILVLTANKLSIKFANRGLW